MSDQQPQTAADLAEALSKAAGEVALAEKRFATADKAENHARIDKANAANELRQAQKAFDTASDAFRNHVGNRDVRWGPKWEAPVAGDAGP